MQTVESTPWIGASWWAAGPWWGNYIYSAEPGTGPAATTIFPQAWVPFA
jgi:endoglucanase